VFSERAFDHHAVPFSHPRREIANHNAGDRHGKGIAGVASQRAFDFPEARVTVDSIERIRELLLELRTSGDGYSPERLVIHSSKW
jgi:hypothetical protein